MHISSKWWKKANIYRKFAPVDADFSQLAAEQMYLYESQGKTFDNPRNGYYQGKKWQDVTIENWRWSVQNGLLLPYELFEEFPEEWVRRVLSGAKLSPEWRWDATSVQEGKEI